MSPSTPTNVGQHVRVWWEGACPLAGAQRGKLTFVQVRGRGGLERRQMVNLIALREGSVVTGRSFTPRQRRLATWPRSSRRAAVGRGHSRPTASARSAR
jgi:hypothetical protein